MSTTNNKSSKNVTASVTASQISAAAQKAADRELKAQERATKREESAQKRAMKEVQRRLRTGECTLAQAQYQYDCLLAEYRAEKAA